MEQKSPSTTMTEDLRKDVLPVTIFFGVEILVGLIGNILTIYVFVFRYKDCNFRYFVVGLAVTDLIACLTTIPGEIVSQLFWYTYPVPPVCKVKAYFNQWTVVCEAAFLTLIALDRYRKICRPLQWQMNRKNSLYSCVCVFVGSTLLMIQTPIFWGAHTEETTSEDNQKVNVTVCEKDTEYVHTKWPMANVVFVGILDLLAVLSMFIMYIMVAKEILSRQRISKKRQSERLKSESTNSTTREDVSETNISATSDFCCLSDDEVKQDGNDGNSAITDNDKTRGGSVIDRKTMGSERRNKLILRARRKSMMGFILTAIFVVTTFLYWPLITLVSRGILSTLDGVEKVFFFFFLRLYFINHVINPVLYGLMDPQFRQELRRLRSKAAASCSRR